MTGWILVLWLTAPYKGAAVTVPMMNAQACIAAAKSAATSDAFCINQETGEVRRPAKP